MKISDRIDNLSKKTQGRLFVAFLLVLCSVSYGASLFELAGMFWRPIHLGATILATMSWIILLVFIFTVGPYRAWKSGRGDFGMTEVYVAALFIVLIVFSWIGFLWEWVAPCTGLILWSFVAWAVTKVTKDMLPETLDDLRQIRYDEERASSQKQPSASPPLTRYMPPEEIEALFDRMAAQSGRTREEFDADIDELRSLAAEGDHLTFGEQACYPELADDRKEHVANCPKFCQQLVHLSFPHETFAAKDGV